jgi:hypothetical protein
MIYFTDPLSISFSYTISNTYMGTPGLLNSIQWVEHEKLMMVKGKREKKRAARKEE